MSVPTAYANDDILVDAVCYSIEKSSEGIPLDSDDYLVLRDDIVITDNVQGKEKECSVTMCGMDGPMVRVCKNKHYMHTSCLENMCYHVDELSSVVCPQCRSTEIPKILTDLTPVTPYTISIDLGTTKTFAVIRVLQQQFNL